MSTITPESVPGRLNELISQVNLSSPSVTKFDDLRNWLARVLGISPTKAIAIYYVSKPGNLDVRFNQPGSINEHKILGLAVLAEESHLAASMVPASRFVGPGGHIDCMALCARPPQGDWSIRKVLAREGAAAIALIGQNFPGVSIQTVPAASIAAATRSPAGSLSAVPFVSDDRVRRMVRLAIASAPAVMLVGPPGSGKTTLLEEIVKEIQSDLPAYGFRREPSTLWVTPEESWTTRDLVGGETVDEKSRIRFRPGYTLESIRRDEWLVLDEANRADMDRIFGGLLTWLAGHSVELGRASTEVGSPSVVLGWNDAAESRCEGVERLQADDVGSDSIQFLAGREWRLLGTYNALDAQRIFRFGQALGRRFVRVPVSAMSVQEFRQALDPQLDGLPPTVGDIVVGIYRAHRDSKVAQLGPALFFWIPEYVRKGFQLPRLSGLSTTTEASEVGSSLATPDEALVFQLLTEAYVSSAGVWLARLEADELDRLGTLIAPLISEQEWTWLVNLLPSLG